LTKPKPKDERHKRAWGLADLVAVVSAGLVAVGLWWVYPPACLIAAGAGGLFGCYRHVNKRGADRGNP